MDQHLETKDLENVIQQLERENQELKKTEEELGELIV